MQSQMQLHFCCFPLTGATAAAAAAIAAAGAADCFKRPSTERLVHGTMSQLVVANHHPSVKTCNTQHSGIVAQFCTFVLHLPVHRRFMEHIAVNTTCTTTCQGSQQQQHTQQQWQQLWCAGR
jgi:hypothetical protein